MKLMSAPLVRTLLALAIAATGFGAAAQEEEKVLNIYNWSDYIDPALVSAPVTAVSFDPAPWILRGTTTNNAYIPGPPKIVATSPAPGDVLPAVVVVLRMLIVSWSPRAAPARRLGRELAL